MSYELIKYGHIDTHFNASRTKILRVTQEVSHLGLNEYKLISAPDSYTLSNKVDNQVIKWNEKWNLIQLKRSINEERNTNSQLAEAITKEAQTMQLKIDNILKDSLITDNKVDWDSLKRYEDFNEVKPKIPQKKVYKIIPPMPNASSKEFIPNYSLIDKLFKTKRVKKEKEFLQKFEDALNQWETIKNKIEQENRKIDRDHELNIEIWKKELDYWEGRQKEYYLRRNDFNANVDGLYDKYLTKESVAVKEYCEIVLNNSEYPDFFPKTFEIEYNEVNQILIVEYSLPPMESFPVLKEAKYISKTKKIKELYISEIELNRIYENTIYKIALRTIHELFEADTIGALVAITFNGWVNSINKAKGIYENKCILSLQTKKEEFLEINLENIDVKVCFKSLKGVASSKLSSLTSVQPIIQICKTDKRFVSNYEVSKNIDSATNLAAMDWEDFEHLIREIFEKEFSVNGGEVKVTQASRDGGVDVIAFDPDPIRGGKIVIQAKRYTNTVGVSAVRDLYGTVLNEGATKGILVTTADYGPDAYAFAKNKPLTLMNGAHLLYLLEKHGHHVKINLAEAKKILNEGNKYFY